MIWHSFRKRKYPIIVPIIYYFTPYNKKTIGSEFFYFHILEKGWNYEFILEKSMKDASEYMLKKLLKDKNYIKRRLLLSQKIGGDFISLCRKNLSYSAPRGLKTRTEKELLALLNKFTIFYEKFSLVNVTPWLFLADRLYAFLIEKLQKPVGNKANDVFILFSTPNSKSYTKKEELDVISSAIKISENKADINSEAKKLSEKYFWIPFDYYGPELWNEKHYVEKLKKLSESNINSLKVELENNKLNQKQVITDQKNKIKELKIKKDIIDLFEAMKDIAVLQDNKKAITTECHYYLQNLYKEMGRRTNNDFMDFYLLLNEEVKKVISDKSNIKKSAESRISFSVVMIKNGTVKIIREDKAMSFIKKMGVSLPSEEESEGLKEIKGISASAGKASGTIRILLAAKEINKMNKGEILVATMTTPDYVPAMKKAAAIITDEGGITCHAAIVSRELRIPCIIGTKIATKVLKDGDFVGVDANKGIVKILNKK